MNPRIPPALPALLAGLLSLSGTATAAVAPTPTVAPTLDGRVLLSWDPPAGATQVEVRRFSLDLTPTATPTGTLTPLPATATFTALAVQANNGPASFLDANVTNGRSYRYELASRDASGLGTPAPVTVVPFAAPGSVATLGVDLSTSHALRLSWSEQDTTYPVSFYEVYRYDPAVTPTQSPPPTAPVALATALAASPTPLATVGSPGYLDASAATPGPEAHYYLVRAVDDHGHPGAFPPWTSQGALPQARPPVAPQVTALYGPSVSPTIPPTGFGVRLQWNGPASSEGVTTYIILRDTTPVATLLATPDALLAYDDTRKDGGSSPAQSVLYSLSLSNASGAVTTSVLSVLLTKALLSGTVQVSPDATASAVTLTWAQALPGLYGLSGYKVYRSPWGFPTGTASPTPTAFLFVGSTPSTTATPYAVDPTSNADRASYYVEPVDSSGWSGPALAGSPATLRLAPTPPSAPSASLLAGNNRVSVNWSAAGGGFYGPVAGYQLSRYVPGVSSPTPVATFDSAAFSTVDAVPGVGPGTPVAYSLKAKDALGNLSDASGPSNPVTFGALTLPAAPAATLVSGTDQRLVFAWAQNPAPDGVTGYRLFGSDWPTLTVTPTPLAVFTPTPSGMATTLTGLDAFQAAAAYLVADNAQGRGAPATLAGIPVPTYQVLAASVPTRAVSVSWTLSAPYATATPVLDGFRVYRSAPSGSPFTPLATVDAATSSFLDAAAPAGVTVSYRVVLKSGDFAESPPDPGATPAIVAGLLTWPNEPKRLSAISGSSSATLSWAPNQAGEGVGSYLVYKDGAALPEATVLPSPSPSFLSAVTPGVRVFYAVSGSNPSGEGLACAPVTVLPPPALTPMAGLTPPPGQTPTPGVFWITGLTYTGDVAGYTLYRSSDPTFAQSAWAGSANSPASEIPVSVSDGPPVYFRLVAHDSNGLEADPSQSGPLTLVPAPGAPLSLASDASDSAATLFWSPPAGASVTGYSIYRGTQWGGAKTYLGAPAGPTPSYVDASVAQGQAYYYQVSSLNAAGEGPVGNERGVLVLAAPTVFLTPSASSNTLAWVPVEATPTPPFTGYAIYRRQLPATVMVQVGSVPAAAGTPNRFTDTGISSGLTYVYQVAPSASSGAVGGVSAPLTQAVLPQPAVVTAVSGDGLVQLRWDYQGGGGTTYTIQRRLGTDLDSNFATLVTGLRNLDYLDTGVVDKGYYAYRVITVSASGLTQVSNNVFALPAKPPVVRGPVAADPGNAGVALGWIAANSPDPVSGLPTFDPAVQYPLAGYRVYRSTDNGGTFQLIATVGPDVTGYVDPVNVIGDASWTYVIRAFDAPPDFPDMSHEAPYPPVRVDSLKARTSLDRNALRPFGSAAERTVNIRFTSTATGHVSVKVFSLSGVFVRQVVDGTFPPGIHWASWDGTNRDGSRVASGVYLVTTDMPNHQEVEKIAVVK